MAPFNITSFPSFFFAFRHRPCHVRRRSAIYCRHFILCSSASVRHSAASPVLSEACESHTRMASPIPPPAPPSRAASTVARCPSWRWRAGAVAQRRPAISGVHRRIGVNAGRKSPTAASLDSGLEPAEGHRLVPRELRRQGRIAGSSPGHALLLFHHGLRRRRSWRGPRTKVLVDAGVESAR